MTKKQLEAKLRRFTRAANWATGCAGDFEPSPKDFDSNGRLHPFWWRSELVRRAGLKWDRKKLRYV